jgi:hypothetical protein
VITWPPWMHFTCRQLCGRIKFEVPSRLLRSQWRKKRLNPSLANCGWFLDHGRLGLARFSLISSGSRGTCGNQRSLAQKIAIQRRKVTYSSRILSMVHSSGISGLEVCNRYLGSMVHSSGISHRVNVIALYLASAVDHATTTCFLLRQETRLSPTNTQYPDVDLRSSRLLA